MLSANSAAASLLGVLISSPCSPPECSRLSGFWMNCWLFLGRVRTNRPESLLVPYPLLLGAEWRLDPEWDEEGAVDTTPEYPCLRSDGSLTRCEDSGVYCLCGSLWCWRILGLLRITAGVMSMMFQWLRVVPPEFV